MGAAAGFPYRPRQCVLAALFGLVRLFDPFAELPLLPFSSALLPPLAPVPDPVVMPGVVPEVVLWLIRWCPR